MHGIPHRQIKRIRAWKKEDSEAPLRAQHLRDHQARRTGLCLMMIMMRGKLITCKKGPRRSIQQSNHNTHVRGVSSKQAHIGSDSLDWNEVCTCSRRAEISNASSFNRVVDDIGARMQTLAKSRAPILRRTSVSMRYQCLGSMLS